MAVLDVVDSDELIMISEKGVTIRSSVSEMRTISRATQGVRLINLTTGDRLTSVARIDEDKDVDSNGSVDD